MDTKDVVGRLSGESSKKRKDISLENGVKVTGQEWSHGSENTACSEAKVCKQGETEKQGSKQPQIMKIMTDMIRKLKKSKEQNGRTRVSLHVHVHVQVP